MRKPFIQIDDSLIISRVQHQELSDIRQNINFDSLFFPLFTKTSLEPFFDNLPSNLNLDLQLLGDRIVNARMARGYFRHGLEKTLALDKNNAIFAVSRLNFAAPIFYQVAVLLALKDLFKLPHQQNYAVAMEFARIAHHRNVVENIFLSLQLNSFIDLIRDFFQVLEKPLVIFSRIHHVVDDVSLNNINFILNEGDVLISELLSRLSQEPTLFKALTKKAVIHLPLATSLGLTGPYLRANRSFYDLRHQKYLMALHSHYPETCVTDGGDAWARFCLRLLEILASIKWLKHLSANSHGEAWLPLAVENFPDEKPEGFAFSEIEGPEGDIKLSVFVDEISGEIIFRLRSPAYFVAQAIPHILLHTRLRDVPVILNSLGIRAEEADF